ncbi:ABC transporter permease [Rhodobacteraceae bacterium D3-12]|nr:ABC transporter permease [Rhodobacteraceae bacterium D3-12]
MKAKQNWRLLALLLPAIALIGVLFINPLVGVLVQSFVGDDGFTLKSISKLWTSRLARVVLERTFWLAFTVTVICLLIGYPAAYYMSQMKPRKRAMITYLVLLPFWISILIRTYTWIILLGREGLVNSALQWLGLTEQPVQFLYTNFAVHLGMVQILLPIVILPTVAGMVNIDTGLIKAARVMGASPIRAFWSTFFPLSLSGAATGGLICFILSLGFYVTPTLLGGQKSLIIANLIDLQVHKTLNWGFAAALATALLLATLLCLLIFWLATRNRPEFATGGLSK